MSHSLILQGPADYPTGPAAMHRRRGRGDFRQLGAFGEESDPDEFRRYRTRQPATSVPQMRSFPDVTAASYRTTIITPKLGPAGRASALNALQNQSTISNSHHV